MGRNPLLLGFEFNKNVRKAFAKYEGDEICPLYVFVPLQHHYCPPLPGVRLVLDRSSLFVTYFGLQVMHSGFPFTQQRRVWGRAYVHGAIGGTR